MRTGPANYDASWVFVKYQVGEGPWRHAAITGFTDAPADCEVSTTADTRGAFIHRATVGNGDVEYNDIKLTWNYGVDGVADDALIRVQVFAVEMVYIPEGAFSLGTGGTEASAFYEVPASGTVRTPYRVFTPGEINVGNVSGQLNYDAGGNAGDALGPISAAYPEGYGGFYVMKYEVTQGEYVAAFNTLEASQRTGMDISDAKGKNGDAPSNRNTFSWDGTGDATTTSPAVPVSQLTSGRVLAFLDWSGLRPLSELEYEKACRGGRVAPIPGEFAWGGTNIRTTAYTTQQYNQINELIIDMTSEVGNASYLFSLSDTTTGGVNNGPYRVGIHAASAPIKDREATGSGYYGVQDLSGNLFEFVISVGDSFGRNFPGTTYGDGELTNLGEANVTGWPAANTGYGFRGGGYSSTAASLTVSRRTSASFNSSNNGFSVTGFRGARSKD